MALVFEWDDWKGRENERKHGVSFDEASSVFDDSLAKIFPDEDHSNGEEREMIVGHSVLDRLLVVSFTERVRSRIRVISARRATRREQTAYEEEA
jgi:uncharacterized protein